MKSKRKLTIVFNNVFLCFVIFMTTFQNVKCDYVLKKEMANVQSVEELCKFLQPDTCEVLKNMTYANDSSNGDKVHVTGSSTNIAAFDACNPRMMTVKIPPHPMYPDLTVWPSCTRAMQCGGCCTSMGFSCEPTATKDKLINVMDLKAPYPGAVRMTSVGVRGVKITEHTACESRCKTKQTDCHPNQIYDSFECRCTCSAARLELKKTCSGDQIWDEISCRCTCPNMDLVTCPVNQVFNTYTCRCSLQHSVVADIDIEKLLEYIEKGIVDKDIILKKEEGNVDVDPPVQVEGLKSETENVTSSSKSTSSEQTPVTPSGNESSTEPMSTGNMFDALDKFFTIPPGLWTPKPIVTPDPCIGKTCFGTWKPLKLNNGQCACRPP